MALSRKITYNGSNDDEFSIVVFLDIGGHWIEAEAYKTFSL